MGEPFPTGRYYGAQMGVVRYTLRMKRRRLLTGFIVLCVLAGAGVWYMVRAGLFEDAGPTNLPTAEELERMREIDQSSSQVAPNAKPGAGVFAPGTLPPPPPVENASSTTATSTDTTDSE